MGTLTLAQGKGGSGKTLVGMCVATEAVRRGLSVMVIDADSGQQFGTYFAARRTANNGVEDFTYTVETNGNRLVDAIERAETEYDLVLVDTPADLSDLTVYAVGVSDFVLVPIVASANDVRLAFDTVEMIRSATKITKRKIPAAAVINRANPQTNIFKFLRDEIHTHLAIDVLDNMVGNRAAFVEMLNTGSEPSPGRARLEIRWLFQELVEKGAVPAKPEKKGEAA